MYLPQAKLLVKRRLGNPTNADILEIIEGEMALVQETTLEQNGRIIPWFMETELASILVAAPSTTGDDRVELPSDFVREKADGGLFLYDAAGEEPWTKLEKRDYDELVRFFQNEVGNPQGYSIGGLYFRLRPLAETDITLKMFYYAKATSVAGGNDTFENIWLKYAPDLLIAETAKVVAEKILQDFDLAGTFVNDIQRAWDRINTDTVAREEEGRSRNFGDPS